MKVAIDAMGGDYPENNIKGAIKSLDDPEIEIFLVGEPEKLTKNLESYSYEKDRIQIIPSDEAIRMDEQPGIAIKRRPNCSINVCSGLVKKGLVNGYVSAGNSGATFASSAGILGMFEGLSKPCVGGAVFGFAPKTLVLDLGLNVESTPEQMLDFAALGISQAKILLDIENPTVGLLSNGSESNKGNKLIKETFKFFEKSSINFQGNIEGHDIALGKVNVVVCDGFTGNILLKAIEGFGHVIHEFLKKEINDDKYLDIINMIPKKTNIMREYGGGPVFGVNGIAIVAHGSSSPTAISNGISTVSWLTKKDYINRSIKELSEIRGSINE